jgi:hypothetical protein
MGAFLRIFGTSVQYTLVQYTLMWLFPRRDRRLQAEATIFWSKGSPVVSGSSLWVRKGIASASRYWTLHQADQIRDSGILLPGFNKRSVIRTDSARRADREAACPEWGPMTRDDALLAILAASGGRNYAPAQIQKAVFLITENLPRLVTKGPKYQFEPYDYGPFDRHVYTDCETLAAAGKVEILQGPRWKYYTATDEGVKRGNEILNSLSEIDRKYIVMVSNWVRSLTFEQLVKSIYQKYPKMKVNSIFRG